MVARIYKPAKTAMQSGTAGDQEMGSGISNPRAAARGRAADGLDQFGRHALADAPRPSTKDEAIAYAERNGIKPYAVIEPKTRKAPTESPMPTISSFGRIDVLDPLSVSVQ